MSKFHHIISILRKKSITDNEKIGMILIAKKCIDNECNSTKSDNNSIHSLVDTVTPSFILSMILYNDDAMPVEEAPSSSSRGKQLANQVGMWLIEQVCNDASTLILFQYDMRGIIICLIEAINMNNRTKVDLLLMLINILCNNMSTDTIYELTITTLLDALENTSVKDPITILDIVSDLCSIQSIDRQKHRQPFVLSMKQGAVLRSIVTQCMHGGAPEYIRDAAFHCLHVLLSSDRILSCAWTLEQSNIPAKDDKVIEIGSFAMLIVSVIRGEMHLLLEEAVCVYEGKEELYADNGSNIANIRMSRNKRLIKVIYTACDLIDDVLLLLIGTGEGNNDDATDDACWSSMPYKSLLHIRQTIHSILQELFDLFSFSSSRVLPPSLQQLLQRVASTIFKWVSEDQDVIGTFLDKLPVILCSSAITSHCILGNSRSTSSDDDGKAVINIILRSSSCEEDRVDILLAVLPCLLGLSSQLDIKTDDSTIDKVCLVNNLLLGLIGIVTVCCNDTTTAYSSDKISDSSSCMYSKHIENVCKMLCYLLSWKEEELLILWVSEQYDAFKSVYYQSNIVHPFQHMHETMHRVAVSTSTAAHNPLNDVVKAMNKICI